MTIFLIILAIAYVIGAIVTFGHMLVELTLDSDGLIPMLIGTFASILSGIFWPVIVIYFALNE